MKKITIPLLATALLTVVGTCSPALHAKAAVPCPYNAGRIPIVIYSSDSTDCSRNSDRSDCIRDFDSSGSFRGQIPTQEQLQKQIQDYLQKMLTDYQCKNSDKPGSETPDNVEQPTQNLPDASTETDQAAPSYADQVVSLVNAERAKAGLSALTVDSSLQAAADVRAREIETSFSHTRPDGTSFATAIKAQGITYRTAGENIAYGQRTPEEVVNAWMNSEGHRANILNAGYTKIGVGYYQNSRGVNYWSQEFTN